MSHTGNSSLRAIIAVSRGGMPRPMGWVIALAGIESRGVWNRDASYFGDGLKN